MRWLRPSLAAIAVLLIVGTALADYNVQNKGSYYSNAGTGLRTNSTGVLMTEEATPAMDANLTFLPENCIAGTSALAIGAADSSGILDTHRMKLGMLLIKAVPSGTNGVDTTVTVRLAVQVRTHLNGSADSSSTFAIYHYGYAPVMNGTGAAAVADTSVQGHLYSGVVLVNHTATPSAVTTWSGEFAVLVSAKRSAHGNSIAVNGHTFYYPSGIAIPLNSLFGREVYSPYTSIRVRVMTVQKGSASLATGTCFVSVALVGTPL